MPQDLELMYEVSEASLLTQRLYGTAASKTLLSDASVDLHRTTQRCCTTVLFQITRKQSINQLKEA